jgi:hypothetical protein
MITPSFSLTATERVLPRLALDFTTASLDPRVTFTRVGATATVVNSSGFVQTVAADTPRFDFNSITLVCRGLLIEEQRANLLLQSQNFGTSWTNTNSSETVDVAISPDGTQNADKLIVNSGAAIGGSQINQTLSKAATATTYTYSVFGQAAGLNRMWLIVSDGLSFSNRANFAISLVDGSVTISAGAVGTFTAASGSVATFKDGWYRASLTFTSSTETSIVARIYPLDSSITTGDGVLGINIWGAQLEAGGFATSYIPTTTTSLTRNADVATMTGANFSDWFNAVEGTLATTGQTIGGTPNPIYINDGTANNRINLINRLSGVLGACAAMFTAGASQLGATSPFTFSQKNTSVLSYKTDNGTVAINALTPNTDNTVTLPVVDRMNIGASVTATSNIWIEKIMFWNIAVTAAEVQAFSKG